MYATTANTSELVRNVSETPRLANRGFLAGVMETVYVWQQRARDRAHLATLDEHLLRDIGLNRGDALREAAKPFWRE